MSLLGWVAAHSCQTNLGLGVEQVPSSLGLLDRRAVTGETVSDKMRKRGQDTESVAVGLPHTPQTYIETRRPPPHQIHGDTKTNTHQQARSRKQVSDPHRGRCDGDLVTSLILTTHRRQTHKET